MGLYPEFKWQLKLQKSILKMLAWKRRGENLQHDVLFLDTITKVGL